MLLVSTHFRTQTRPLSLPARLFALSSGKIYTEYYVLRGAYHVEKERDKKPKPTPHTVDRV